MAYTTVTDLQEKYDNNIEGSEFLLISTDTNSYKISVDNIKNFVDNELQLDSRIYELEHRIFQQTTTPIESVNIGDVWLDTIDNVLKVYREYPAASGNFRWEPLLYKWDDTVDGGIW